jgi:hypothetical protein
MKLKKITVSEPTKTFGIRMAKKSAAACTPKISGLFLQDDNLDWKVTAITVSGTGTQYSFIPVRLMGETCCLPVVWSTEWTPAGYEGTEPVFFGQGSVGIVGHVMSGGEGQWEITMQPGTLRIWAKVAGKEYGPVTVTFEGGGSY